MRQRRYLQNLVNCTHSSMRIEYKMKSWQKVNANWEERKRGKKGFQEGTNTNSLFHSIWFRIRWWRRWAAAAPARRAGCCAVALSPWWPHWPGMELFRQEHVNKRRANPLCIHTHAHMSQPQISHADCFANTHSETLARPMNIHSVLLNVYTSWSKFQLQRKQRKIALPPSRWKTATCRLWITIQFN